MLRFAITDRFLFTNGDTGPLVEGCGALAQSGIDFILVREKDLPAGELVRLCRAIWAVVRGEGAGTRVLVSSRVDVALAAGLDGVHLTSQPGELSPEQVRRLMPEGFVSVSCHTDEDVQRAKVNGASAILFAPIFNKKVHGQQVAPGIGLNALETACTLAAPIPVLALGGITPENTSACLQAGAAGIAAIRMFYGS